MKVLIVNNLFPPHTMGGAERSVDALVDGLRKRGVEIVVLTLAPPGKPVPNGQYEPAICRTKLRNLYWPFDEKTRYPLARLAWHALDSYNPLMLSAVRSRLATERPDLMHTNNLAGFSVAAWRAARERGVPVIHTIRDYYLVCLRSTRQKHGSVCANACTECAIASVPRRWASRVVTTVIGNSRYVLDAHVDAGHFENATHRDVIYNAYEPPSDVRVAESRQHGEPLRFGYLGRLHPTKGVEVLIDAFASAHAGAARLAIAGTGNEEYVAELRRRARDAPIDWIGHVEPSAFLSGLDVLVVPSTWDEPLPRSVYEAYAHGVAVLASCRGGTPEIVEDGVNGMLFDPRAAALAPLLSRCIAEPELVRRLRRGARASASRFLPEETVSRYLLAYQRTIECARRSRDGG